MGWVLSTSAGGEPGAAQLGDAEGHLVELLGGVGVGVDDDLAAEFFGAAEVQVAQVGAGGRGVVLDGDAKLGGAAQHRLEVDGVGIAAEHLAAGGWPRMRTWGFSRARRTRAVISSIGLVEARVHAGHDDVHLREGGVLEVDRAIQQDVHLDAGQDADAAAVLGLRARGRPRGCGATWASARASSRPLVMARFLEWSVMAMYVETARHRGLGHLADGVAAVGRVGVHVEVAADVGAGDQRRAECRAAAAASISPQFSRSSGGM